MTVQTQMLVATLFEGVFSSAGIGASESARKRSCLYLSLSSGTERKSATMDRRRGGRPSKAGNRLIKVHFCIIGVGIF